MMRYKIILIVLLSVFSTKYGYSQLSYGGEPSSFSSDTYQTILPAIPAEQKAIVSDNLNRVGPLEFAYSFKVNYSCDNDGEWFSLSNGGRLWRMRIKSEGALSLNVIFNKFKIPEGGKVFLYSPDRSTVLGAFTHQNNKSSGIFAVAPVPGDEIVVEYLEEMAVTTEPVIEIGSVNHDYLGIFGYLSGDVKTGWFGDSGDCNVDVNCSNDTPDTIQQSVCKILVDGTMLCTGTLINNTRNDGTPYFLTAAHCLTKANSDKSIIFYFNYETPSCISFVEGTKNQTLTGSTLKAQVDTLDFALVEMDNMPPATYRPYWAGWNISTLPAAPFVSIHHPQGDVKKIALENDNLIATTFDANDVNGNKFVKDAHWLVQTWESGTTEGGSSGGGIFDADAKLVGTLSGGEAYCGNSVNDYYARLNKMWNYLAGVDQQVAHWLDPDNTGVSQMEGFDYYSNKAQVLSHLSKTDTVKLLNGNGLTGYWSGHNSLGITEYAEYYSGIQSASVEGIYLIFGQRLIGADDTVRLKLWSGTYSGPEVLLAEKAFAVSSLAKNRQNLLSFDQPVSVSGSFFAGIEIEYGTTQTDTVALYQIESKTGTTDEYGFLYEGGSWKRLSDIHPDGVNGDYWIDVLASDVTFTADDDDTYSKNDLSVYPNPVTNGKLFFNVNNQELRYVELYSINGSQLLHQLIGQGVSSGYVDVSGISAGIYIVRFVFSNMSVSKKVMVK